MSTIVNWLYSWFYDVAATEKFAPVIAEINTFDIKTLKPTDEIASEIKRFDKRRLKQTTPRTKTHKSDFDFVLTLRNKFANLEPSTP